MKNKKKIHELSTVNRQLSTVEAGFTLIELILSMAMVAILTAAVIGLANFSDTHKSLTLAADEFRAAIRSAQSSSLSIPNPTDEHVCGFGIKILSANTYETYYTYLTPGQFQGDPDMCKTEVQFLDGSEVGTLVNYVIVSSHTLPNPLVFDGSRIGESIFFKTPYGEVHANNGSLATVSGDFDAVSGELNPPFEIKNSAGDLKSVVVTKYGRIE